MRRTTVLTTALLLGSALLTPTTGSTLPATDRVAVAVAGKTCRGLPVTIHAVDRDVRGTEGPDVVLLEYTRSRFGNVETLGGNDVVCIRGDVPDYEPGTGANLQIAVGAGDDIVDSTQAPTWNLLLTLGSGSDRFEGGAARDEVSAGDWGGGEGGHVDTEPDVIIGGGGNDHFYSGTTGEPNGDVVDAGAGDDYLDLEGYWAGGGSVSGGAGLDHLLLILRGQSATLDTRAGRYTEDDRTSAVLDGFDSFSVSSTSETSDLTFLGSEADESLYANGRRLTARLRGGDDVVGTAWTTEETDIDGGRGRDTVSVGANGDTLLALDLQAGSLNVTAPESSHRAKMTGFESAIVTAHRVRVSGTGQANRLAISSCFGSARGRGGDDLLIAKEWGRLWPSRECHGSDLFGGTGDDELRGGSRDDTLIGGAGRDVARGHKGRDRCAAEVRSACERRA